MPTIRPGKTADESTGQLATEPALAASDEPLIAGGQVGKYQLTGFLGSGGMGVVLAAHDPELDRRVALKVLHPGAPRRLIEEARAMARLAHPNVVTVYEVWREGDREVLAMELVEGKTLRAWQDAAPRGWRELTAMYLAAGRGLVAAHQVGLVHRDFKPENVLIGADGRPRVADFGLVVSDRVPDEDALAGFDLRRSITVDGVAAGTPRYMAPEQWGRRTVGPRADVFAFSVALWEAVNGLPPFQGETPRDLKLAVLSGRMDAPGRRMPRWLEKALRRGLAVEEGRRWESMQGLLDRLQAGLENRRTAIVAGGLVVVLAAAALFAIRGRDACPPPTERAQAVWSDARRADLERRLAQVDAQRGAGRLAGLAPVLEQATRGFSDMHVEACRATRVDGRQSDLLLARRMRCLDGWLAEVDARVGALESAGDPAAVDLAAQGALGLPALGACADLEALSAAWTPDRGEGEAAATLAEELRVLRALGTGVDPGHAAALVARARALGHAGLVVEALEVQAGALLEVEDPAGVGRVLDELLDAAARARDDRRAALAWLLRLRVETMLIYRPDRALVLFPAAEAAVTRAGNPLELRVELLTATAGVLSQVNRAPEALARLGEAGLLLASADAGSPGSPHGLALADVERANGTARLVNRQAAEALVRFDAAAAELTRRLGPDHPRLVDVHLGRSEALRQLGRMEDSLAAADQALHIRRARQPGTPALAETLSMVGGSLNELSRFEEARVLLAEATELGRRVLPADSVRLALILTRYAGPVGGLGKREEANALYDEAIAIQERRGSSHRAFALTYGNRGDGRKRADRCEEAVADYLRSIDMLEEVSGPGSVFVVQIAMGLAECLHELGRAAEAIPHLEAALVIDSEGYLEPVKSLDRWMLGRILVETGRDRARGHALVDQARAEVVASGVAWTPQALAEIDGWRKAHPRP